MAAERTKRCAECKQKRCLQENAVKTFYFLFSTSIPLDSEFNPVVDKQHFNKFNKKILKIDLKQIFDSRVSVSDGGHSHVSSFLLVYNTSPETTDRISESAHKSPQPTHVCTCGITCLCHSGRVEVQRIRVCYQSVTVKVSIREG